MIPIPRLFVFGVALLHLWIGLHELLEENGSGQPAWLILYRVVPVGVWCGLWLVAGLFFLVDALFPTLTRWLPIVDRWFGRAGFLVSAGLFLLWGVGAYLSWLWDTGSTLHGTLAFLYLAFLQMRFSWVLGVMTRTATSMVEFQAGIEETQRVRDVNACKSRV